MQYSNIKSQKMDRAQYAIMFSKSTEHWPCTVSVASASCQPNLFWARHTYVPSSPGFTFLIFSPRSSSSRDLSAVKPTSLCRLSSTAHLSQHSLGGARAGLWRGKSVIQCLKGTTTRPACQGPNLQNYVKCTHEKILPEM